MLAGIFVAGGQKTLRPPLHRCKKSRILTRATRANNKMLCYSLVGERLRERERERERVIKFSRPPNFVQAECQ